jgi:predicted permease
MFDKHSNSLAYIIAAIALIPGFGDIAPISIIGKIAAICEVLLGYAIFGILITMVARKMTRH